MDLNLLKVYKCPYPKLRIGQEYDGGYITCDIPNVKYDLCDLNQVDQDSVAAGE